MPISNTQKSGETSGSSSHTSKTHKHHECKSKNKSEGVISFKDVMQSKPKFLIFSLLSMFPELSLKQLKEFTSKSKSTISIHLSDMERMGLVRVAREEKARGSIPTKYFRLVEDYEEKIARRKCENHEDRIAEFKEFLQIHQSFAQVQSQLLSKWLKYLSALEKRLDSNQDPVVIEEISSLKAEKGRLSVVSFYTDSIAAEMRKGLWPIYKKAEHDNKEADKPDPVVHPYFIGVQILPIKRAFDYFFENE
ncbi:MAG: helix-turn-helix domain-containing protein [Candidatus Lokiarchaeota archaeon]|nr:helix-turn-helix domain-containing protein [Candidatus Harpocratesius repetitus]